MLTIEALSAGYGKRNVLEGVSFTALDGRVSVLFGKNGAGKSTLLRAIAEGHPYTGSILVDGWETSRLSSRARARRLALLPQHLPSTDMTVLELCALGRYSLDPFAFRKTEEDREAVFRALLRTGMTEYKNRPVSTLSGGERQRAYLAMLLSGEANTLLFDEPTAALDPTSRWEILRLLGELAREGKCILAVTHDLEGGLSVADDAVLLSRGRALFAGTREALLATDLLEETFALRRFETEGRVFFG